MLAYIDSLKEFKAKVTAFKLEIMDQIEKTFDTKVDQIDSMLDHTYIQLYELNQESDNQILQNFEERGLEGVISDYIYNMNLNVDDVKHSLNNLIILETRDSPQIEARYQTVIPIEIQELRELIQAQTQRSDELENRLEQLREGCIRELQDKSQIQEASIKELQDKAQNTQGSIKGLQARSQMHDNSMKQLEENMIAVYDTLEMLKGYPNSIVQQTNHTLQEVQNLFNEKYTHIDKEINSIKQLTTQIQQIQAENQAREVVKPAPTHTLTEEEVKQPQPIKIPEFEEVKLPQRLATPRVSEEVKSQPQVYYRSKTFTLKNGTKELIKYDSDTDTITTYSLDILPYQLWYAATCMLTDGSIIIAGG
jgi:DNA repair exonuclease SbcCD ATPase subunit